MTVQALPVIDVRKTDVGNMAAIASWLRGIGVRQVRLACGLVMFSYIFSHFFNHALGNISYSLMDLARLSYLVVANPGR
jgi:adenylate cyclase